LIDELGNDPVWADWSTAAMDKLSQDGPLMINPILLAEISERFERAIDVEAALSTLPLKREPLPWDAAFFARQAFRAYRLMQGTKRSPMPDFYIGAHAFVGNLRLLTQDAKRYETYVPRVRLHSPS
jgi:predicted nucleic acid-binding protein